MGIETDRFVDNLPQEVLCPLCCLILKEPVCSPCGHYVCAGCWQSWRRGPSADICPYCSTNILSGESVQRSQTVWKLVLNFNVYCPYNREGCTAIYKLGLEDVHLRSCPYNNENGCERDYLSESELIEKRKALNNCRNCQHTVESKQEHDCLSVLLETVKTQTVQITNLEYENDKLSLRLTSKENEIMDQLVDVENRYQKQALDYEREIRELRTKMAALQGELRKRAGEIEEVDLSISLERQNGSLGLNIVGGYQEGKESSGIFISRIAEDGPASKPGKLLLNDKVLEVNGQDLRQATHEDAVQAFKNSHGIVHLLVKRNVTVDKRKWSIATQTDSSKSCELTDSALMSCSEAEESLISVSENGKVHGPSKSDLYDSAYDTLLTQRSSRSHRAYSVDGSISPIADSLQEPKDVSSESCEDVRTITPSTVVNGYGSNSSASRTATAAVRSGSMSTDDSLSPVHEVKLRRNNNDESSPRKVIRRSTYFLVDESLNDSLSSLMKSLSEESKISGENASVTTSTSNGLDIEYEYEYEEIMLKRAAQGFGILVYCGGEEDDLGVYVGKVEEGSPAHLSQRVMVGDQLIQINNTQIRSVQEANAIFQESEEIKLLVARPVTEMQEQYANGFKSKLEENKFGDLREEQNEIDLMSETTEGSTTLEQIETSASEKAFFVDGEQELGSSAMDSNCKRSSSGLESVEDYDKNMENGSKKPEKRQESKENVKLTLKDYVLSRLRGHEKAKTKGIDCDIPSHLEVSKEEILERKIKKDNEPETPKFSKKDCRKDSLTRKEKRESSNSSSPARTSETTSPNHLLSQKKPMRSAMRKESSRNKSPKHVRVDTKTDWTVTEKRVWEEFKIIQNMEAEEGKGQTGVEAEWKVRRSKDGKHIYIRKQSSKPNKSRFLKERAERLVAERTGITTDDDANTIYLGRFWNKEERKRQLLRHRLKREKLLERQIAKDSTPPNPLNSVMADIVQKRMTAPGHVFDDFLTVEEILSQRNKDGFLQGPIHVTTV